MVIGINETEIIGNWVFINNHVIADDQCQRIELLIKEHLIKLASDVSGWEVLYFDSTDNRYWEKVYLQGEMHGGGPPSLFLISESQAKNKYPI